MATITERTWKNGIIIEETTSEVDWQPSEADLDLVKMVCECSHEFDMPWDVLAFCGVEGMHCGQCGESGKLKQKSN